MPPRPHRVGKSSSIDILNLAMKSIDRLGSFGVDRQNLTVQGERGLEAGAGVSERGLSLKLAAS